MTATLRRPAKRERADWAIDVLGVTTDCLVWRADARAYASTPFRQIRAALNRDRGGLTLLDGFYVNSSDLGTLVAAIDTGHPRLCASHLTHLGADGHCPECVTELTRWES
jgi:hypothetical protein